MRRRTLMLSPLAAVAACATPAPGAPVLLLGEVHDNAAGHAWRRAHLTALLAEGARPALALEMLDRADQPALDAERPRHASAATLVPAVLAARPGGPPPAGGWHWPFYAPMLDLALMHGLPIVAANVGRDEARRVMREGLAATGFDAAVPDDLLAAQAGLIEASHCGQVGGDLARRMALAQVARDQQMARAVEAHAARGVVLLAGNGHVRTDIGVPRWLTAATRTRCQALGVLEEGDATVAFDRRVFVPAQARPDPCAGLTIRR